SRAGAAVGRSIWIFWNAGVVAGDDGAVWGGELSGDAAADGIWGADGAGGAAGINLETCVARSTTEPGRGRGDWGGSGAGFSAFVAERSEERRVGKGWRGQWGG